MFNLSHSIITNKTKQTKQTKTNKTKQTKQTKPKLIKILDLYIILINYTTQLNTTHKFNKTSPK